MLIQTEIYMLLFQFNLSLKKFYSLRKKYFIALVMMFMATTNSAYAEDVVPDKFKISLGGYSLIRNESSMSLTEPNLGAGISISPQDTLGLKTEQTVLRLDGYYRFTKTHALTYSWYSISSDGKKTIEEEFDWLDEEGNEITIPIGAKVDTALNFDVYKLGYLWSFHHTDKVKMAVGAGLHITRIAIGLSTDTTSSGVDASDTSTTLPLPVLSFDLRYKVTPKFGWSLKSEWFVLKFEDWDGLYTDVTLAMEYRVFKNVGLGAGLSSNNLEISEDASDHKFKYESRITGVLIYAATYF